MEMRNGYLRQVCRGWVKVNERHYWHKALEKYDSKTVMVVPADDGQTAQVFYNELLICNNARVYLLPKPQRKMDIAAMLAIREESLEKSRLKHQRLFLQGELSHKADNQVR